MPQSEMAPAGPEHFPGVGAKYKAHCDMTIARYHVYNGTLVWPALAAAARNAAAAKKPIKIQCTHLRAYAARPGEAEEIAMPG